jgi:DNA polymerase III subunit chi
LPEISFYHLTRQPLDAVLPKLLEKAHGAGHRILLRAPSAERMAALDTLLWIYDPDSFLPHGRADAEHPDLQPILLTTGRENLNAASHLCTVDALVPEDAAAFTRCLYLFDGQDDAQLVAARTAWKRFKDAGFHVTYWQQNDRAGWTKASEAGAPA